MEFDFDIKGLTELGKNNLPNRTITTLNMSIQ